MKFATAALIVIAAQATQVFAAAAVDPLVEECGALGVMKYTAKAGENVDTSSKHRCPSSPVTDPVCSLFSLSFFCIIEEPASYDPQD